MCILLSVDIILATQKGITDRCCAGDAESPGVANDDDNVLFFFHYLFVLVTASKQTATPIMQCGLRGKRGAFDNGALPWRLLLPNTVLDCIIAKISAWE